MVYFVLSFYFKGERGGKDDRPQQSGAPATRNPPQNDKTPHPAKATAILNPKNIHSHTTHEPQSQPPKTSPKIHPHKPLGKPPKPRNHTPGTKTKPSDHPESPSRPSKQKHKPPKIPGRQKLVKNGH